MSAIWAFDLGKRSIGEAVWNVGEKRFDHVASLLIPAEFASTMDVPNVWHLVFEEGGGNSAIFTPPLFSLTKHSAFLTLNSNSMHGEQGMSEEDNKNEDYLKGGAAAAAGAIGGWAFAVEIGTMGLTAAGTGVSIGAAPVIAAGAIIGLAGFGIYKIFAGK